MVPSRPLRVLRLTPHFYFPHGSEGGWPTSHDPIGGMQSQIYGYVDGLSRNGVEQVVLTLGLPNAPKQWKMDERTTVHSSLLPLLPIHSELRGSVGLNETWTASVMLWIAKNLGGERFDVVHAHGSGVCWPLMAGVPAARLFGARLVYTIHCSKTSTYHAMSKLDAVLHPIGQWWEHACLRRADKVVTLTQRTADAYVDRGILTRDKLTIIPDGLDAATFAADATPERTQAFRERYGIPADKPVVLYLGRIAIEKGWPLFVKMAKQLASRGVHFLVCGDGNQRSHMEAQVDALGLRSSFTITGFVPREDVPLALAASDVFVLTSQHEEFGSSTLEAMAMKVPVVLSKIGGLAETLDHEGNAMLADPADYRTFVDAAARLLDDPALARRLAEGGRRFVATMSLTKRVEELAELYTSLVVPNRPAPAPQPVAPVRAAPFTRWPRWPRTTPLAREYVSQALDSGRWSVRGFWEGEPSFDQRFSEAFCEAFGAAHCIGVSSGSAALEMALEALDVGPGDLVAVPALTWVASASAVLRVGATPVFVDVDPETSCLSVVALERALAQHPSIRAVVAVHLHASLVDLDALLRVTRAHGVDVVEDVAQAAGAVFDGRRVGTFGRIGCFSFNQEKVLACGEGGALVTDDEELAERLHALRADGYRFDAHHRVVGERQYVGFAGLPGANRVWSELQAAVALATLTDLDADVETRARNAAYLDRAFAARPWAIPLRTPAGTDRRSVYEYAVKIPGLTFDELEAFGQEVGALLELPVHPTDPPVYRHPNLELGRVARYRELRIPTPVSFPGAEAVFAQLLVLPQWALLASTEDMDAIVRAFDVAASRVFSRAKTKPRRTASKELRF